MYIMRVCSDRTVKTTWAKEYAFELFTANTHAAANKTYARCPYTFVRGESARAVNICSVKRREVIQFRLLHGRCLRLTNFCVFCMENRFSRENKYKKNKIK